MFAYIFHYDANDLNYANKPHSQCLIRGIKSCIVNI